ncbi:ciliogenesis and planar polarity effector 1-like [Amphiura filiformis]|uniref:ciliogenesis and planar polarity effector 1-like n=1 Tax=Amphiura filiformis TaxID=82378 RepID=UPI003B220BE7
MRVDVKVTHTPDLKSKQPWPKLAWQGNQANNLLLLDTSTQRMKVLCITASGKGDTKKKIARLQSRLQHICVSCVSPCGNFLVCLQHTGDILVWHKDTDKLQTIKGIPELVTHKPQDAKGAVVTRSSKPQLFISKDVRKLLVVIGCSRLFLWEIDQSGGQSSGKQAGVVKGNWSHIGVSEWHAMPSAECKEAVVHGRFFSDVVLGECCVCSFVFNKKDQVHVTSVLLRWTGPQFMYSVRWTEPQFMYPVRLWLSYNQVPQFSEQICNQNLQLDGIASSTRSQDSQQMPNRSDTMGHILRSTRTAATHWQ